MGMIEVPSEQSVPFQLPPDILEFRDLARSIVREELLPLEQRYLTHPGKEVLPGLIGFAAPGHTPGHLAYLMDDGEKATIFTGDSAKNRVESRLRQCRCQC